MKRVLAIDGGGIRGLIPAVVLRHLEDEWGPLHDAFDLVGGTSTGGILAWAIGMGVPMADVVELYQTKARDIFRRSVWWRIKTGNGAWGPKYDGKGLQQALDDTFGDAWLHEAKTRVMSFAYDMRAGTQHIAESTRFGLVRHAAYDTSAAPTYFPAINDVIDGGVWANNPARAVYTEARKLWPDDTIELWSLGTGTSNPRWKNVSGWGLVKWAKAIISVMMDGSSDGVHYHLNRELWHYHRIQPTIRPVAMDTTDPADLEYLVEVGEIEAPDVAA